MRHLIHFVSVPVGRWTPERIAGVGFVGALHVVALYALVTGLAQKIVKVIPHDLTVTMEPVQEQKQERVAPPRPTDLPTLPMEQTVPIPVFRIADDTPKVTAQQMPDHVASIAPDTAASSISSTHTTPPYPPIARKLGERGEVKLRLTISAQGVIAGANVVQSSGFPDLDQTAVNWVMSHWKYKHATQGGVAVGSTALAVVVFNLRTSG